ANDFLRAGGAYFIALGADLPDKLVERRRRAVAQKAVLLGLIADDDRERIRVYAADALARWASRFPSLAVSRLLGGPGSVAIPYDAWARSRWHQSTWVADASRTELIAGIRSELSSRSLVDLRVDGDSGIGKTRLVL